MKTGYTGEMSALTQLPFISLQCNHVKDRARTIWGLGSTIHHHMPLWWVLTHRKNLKTWSIAHPSLEGSAPRFQYICRTASDALQQKEVEWMHEWKIRLHRIFKFKKKCWNIPVLGILENKGRQRQETTFTKYLVCSKRRDKFLNAISFRLIPP